MSKLHPTPERVWAAIDYLRRTPPYNRLSLPPTEEIGIRIVKSEAYRGRCYVENGRHYVEISMGCICRTHSLIEATAHELIHLYLDRKGVRSDHGTPFRRIAKRVCDIHGFDPKLF